MATRINNTDVNKLGIYILRGGADELLRFAERREPDSTSWYERDGIDVDLSTPLFKAVEVEVTYIVLADAYLTYEECLSGVRNVHRQGLNTIEIDGYGSFEVQLQSFTSMRHKGGIAQDARKKGEITVSYLMPNPLARYTKIQPGEAFKFKALNALNDRDLSEFGIAVQELYDSTLKPLSCKQGLVRDLPHLSGVIAYSNSSATESKEIVLSGEILASTPEGLVGNLQALWQEVSQPGALKLTTPGGSFNCYYTSMSSLQRKNTRSQKMIFTFTLNFKTL